MAKITIVGAGAFVFPVRLSVDILSFPSLEDSTLTLMDIHEGRCARTGRLVRKVVERFGLGAKVETTTDLRRALDGADYAIIAWQVGGINAYKYDVEIPRRYGIDQCVGDTLGPGGVLRALRSVPAYLEVSEAMKRVCPDALLLNYANPVSINTLAVLRAGIKGVGLCHSVQGTSNLLARHLGILPGELDFKCFGINHQAWFTELQHKGKDVYPKLRRLMDRRFPSPDKGEADKSRTADEAGLAFDHGAVYHQERVRTEIMRTFGYFQTESSHHASEYLPWFRKGKALIDAHIEKRWDYYEICRAHDPKRQAQWVKNLLNSPLKRTAEYGAPIMDSIETDTKRVIYGNVPNWGPPGADVRCPTAHLIPNLPQDMCVELACLVDRNGVQPTCPGPLPSGCAAINTASMMVQRLTLEAALTGDRSLVYQAVSMDPMTGAILTLPRIRQMVDEMLKAESRWLPQFAKARKRRP